MHAVFEGDQRAFIGRPTRLAGAEVTVIEAPTSSRSRSGSGRLEPQRIVAQVIGDVAVMSPGFNTETMPRPSGPTQTPRLKGMPIAEPQRRVGLLMLKPLRPACASTLGSEAGWRRHGS